MKPRDAPDGSFTGLYPRDVLSGITEDPPTSSGPLCALSPPPLPPPLARTKAAVSRERSANFSFSSLIITQERAISTVCATFAKFLQTFNGTRRLRRPVCRISPHVCRSHGALRLWFRAPVVPWMFTRRAAVGLALRSVRATR